MADRPAPPRPAPAGWPRAAALVTVPVVIAAVLVVARLRPQVAAAAAPVGAPPRAYVLPLTNSSVVAVGVIDLDANKQTAQVDAGLRTRAVAVTPDGGTVLVAGETIPLGPFGIRPAGTTPAFLVSIDAATNKLRPGAPAAVVPIPRAVAVAPDGLTAFVAGLGGVSVVTIGQGPALAWKAEIPFDGGPVWDVAVSPDGSTLYALHSRIDPTGPEVYEVTSVALPSLKPGPSVAVTYRAEKLVVAPDGSVAYAAARATERPGSIDYLSLRPALGVIRNIILPRPAIALPDPVALSIGTTPDGTSTLYVAMSGLNAVAPFPVPTPDAFTPTSLIRLSTIPVDLAATPDGQVVKVSNARGSLETIDVKTATSDLCLGAPCPPGGGPIAIAPDQRAEASFTVTPALPGLETSFDASGSKITFRTIARYVWDFGDGTPPVTTTTPVATHTYAAAGSYTAMLTETTWSGASVGTSPPSTVMTGHTMTRRGGDPARTTRQVVITGGGPTPSGPTPVLSIVPPVGPPGTVVTVKGTGFPNGEVLLVWQRGIGSAKATAVDGAFTQTILVFPRDDSLGFRMLAAPALPAAVPVPFLVEPASVQPGGSDIDVIFRR